MLPACNSRAPTTSGPASTKLAHADGRAGVVATDGDGTLWSGDVGEDLFSRVPRSRRVHANPRWRRFAREAREHALSDAGTGRDVARRIYDAYLGGRFPEERVCELMTWCFAGWTRDRGASLRPRRRRRLRPRGAASPRGDSRARARAGRGDRGPPRERLARSPSSWRPARASASTRPTSWPRTRASTAT